MTWNWLAVHDPNRINLRKALRTTILSPGIFALLYLGFDKPYLGVFAFLSSFVALVFADFGGPMRTRALAYLVLLVVTVLAVIVATLLAGTVIPAAIAMAAIMFAVSFAGVFGGSVPAFVAPVALAYSFAVFIPLSEVGLETRLIGWSIGSVLAMLGALLLWPVDARARMRLDLASATGALADALANGNDPEARVRDVQRAEEALEKVHKTAASPQRPSGVAAHYVGLLHLLDGLDHAVDLIREIESEKIDQADAPMIEHIVAALRRVEGVLRGTANSASMVDAISALDEARLDRRQQIADEALSAASDEHAADLLSGWRASFSILALSHLVLWVEADAAEATGAGARIHPVASAGELSGDMGEGSSAFLRIRGIAGAQFKPNAVIMRNSLRAAFAMGLGILVAKNVPLDHGFWVALGVLSVLRSSAASTSATAMQAIAGTVGGFLVAGAAVLALHGSTTGIWWLMPPLVFLAAYAPGAIGFAIGQVGFTGFVVLLFNLVDPQGLSTAVVRVETVTLGAATAAVVAFIMWPRGARAALARSVAAVYRVAADCLADCLKDSGEQRQAGARRLESAIRRSHETFAVALGEHGERIDGEVWSRLSRPPALAHSLLCGLMEAPRHPPPPGCQHAVAALEKQAEIIRTDFATIADELENPSAHGSLAEMEDGITVRLAGCLCSCARGQQDRIAESLAIIAWSVWFNRLAKITKQAREAEGPVVGAALDLAWLRWSSRSGTRGAHHA